MENKICYFCAFLKEYYNRISCQVEELEQENAELKGRLHDAGKEKAEVLKSASREKQEVEAKESEIEACRKELQEMMQRKEEAERRFNKMNEVFSSISEQLEQQKAENQMLQVGVVGWFQSSE